MGLHQLLIISSQIDHILGIGCLLENAMSEGFTEKDLVKKKEHLDFSLAVQVLC